MRKIYRRVISLLLAVMMAVSAVGSAAAAAPDEMQPYASAYLCNYLAYAYDAGGGKVQVWFSITGVPDMTTEIGALTIILKESTNKTSWTTVKTFQHMDYDGMLFYGRDNVTSHIDYDDGIPGRYYYAIVTIWGGADGEGDSRRITTDVIRAA